MGPGRKWAQQGLNESPSSQPAQPAQPASIQPASKPASQPDSLIVANICLLACRIKAGKLNLVDLAGSERSSKTGATGQTLKEGIKIN